MPSFNKVILMGNLTRDPESRVTAAGLTIVKLGLAVSRTYSTKDGERREETTFVDLDAFGKTAEVIAEYLKKGSPIHVEGRLKLDQWEAQDGAKRQKLSVVVEKFQFVGGRREDSGDSSGSGRGAHSAAVASDSPPSDDTLDEDVSF